MFKIAKLENVSNENIDIKTIEGEVHSFIEGSQKTETYKTLAFTISGGIYEFSFEFNCPLIKLLDIPMYEKIDINKYLFLGETIFNVAGKGGPEFEINGTITHYLKSKFIIHIEFNTDYGNNDYAGIIEFDFNLDNYL